MTVLTFQPRFAPKVRDGSKRHTIRGERKRPIRAGDALSLREWSGRPYMTPQRLLLEAVCTSVDTVRISYSTTGRPIILAGSLLEPAAADAMAVADGFTSAADLMVWFADTHGLPFHGVLIRWEARP